MSSPPPPPREAFSSASLHSGTIAHRSGNFFTSQRLYHVLLQLSIQVTALVHNLFKHKRRYPYQIPPFPIQSEPVSPIRDLLFLILRRRRGTRLAHSGRDTQPGQDKAHQHKPADQQQNEQNHLHCSQASTESRSPGQCGVLSNTSTRLCSVSAGISVTLWNSLPKTQMGWNRWLRAHGPQREMPQVPPVLQELAGTDANPPRPLLPAPVPKRDHPFFTWVPPHSGHLISTLAVIERTSFSNWLLQSWHVYS